MINITLPDGAQKPFDAPVDGFAVAGSISAGFAGNCVAMEVNGKMVDMHFVIESDANVRFVTKKDPEALDILRHTAAHVMAQAVCNLYPDAVLTIGPVIENGFYYDFDMNPISEEVFPKIESEMKRIIQAKLPIRRKKSPRPRPWLFIKMIPTSRRLSRSLTRGPYRFTRRGGLPISAGGRTCRIQGLSRRSSS